MIRQLHPSSMFWILFFVLILFLSPCQTISNLSESTRPDPVPADDENSSDDSESMPNQEAAEPAAGQDSVATAPEPAAPPPAESPTPAPLPELTFTVQSTTPIPAEGEGITAENGVVVQLPPETLEEGVEAVLSQWEVNPSWRQALEQYYTIETPFVSLAATGVNDGQGRAMLRLPAGNPESRLAIVIDNTYISLLDPSPADGYLETALRLGPSESDNVEQVGSLAPGGSLQLVVLTPKSTAVIDSKYYFGKPARQLGGSCGIHIEDNFGRLTHCRKSDDGLVQVNFWWNIGFSDGDGDQLANAAATALARYRELGFTAANITPRSPMEIVVETRTGDPQYRSINGVIYLPVDAGKDAIAGTAHDTLHEMAHWIEDEEYNMAWAYWSGGKTWWLETAAENMVMLHDPAYVSKNLVTYGPITTDDNKLALQYTPYQWPGDFYAHAQMVKLNMCADATACPLSESTFIAAINAGTYPYSGSGAQSLVSANLDSYANYLLGASPTSGNSAMPLGEPVASGTSYGEFVEIMQSNKSDYKLTYNGIAPQMKKESDNLGETITVAATIQKDGVYPFSVSSGLNGRFPGMPVALTIPPGAPFWYRLGSDAPLFHDGSKEMIFQPIHLTMGLPKVRLVAMGKSGGETFKATVSQIDLQGVWLIETGEQVGGKITCLEETTSADLTASLEADSVIGASVLVGSMGDFRHDSQGNSMTWEWNMARVPPEAVPFIGSTLDYKGAVLPGVDKIQLETKLDWKRTPAEASAQPQWPPLLFGMAAIVPGAWAWRQGRKRPHIALLSLLLAAFLLVGCFGLGVEFWGTMDVNAQFTELEYIGGETTPVLGLDQSASDTPLWKLKGTADYEVDFSVVATADDGESAAEQSVARCTGTATYNVNALIFKDVSIALE